MRKTHDGRPLYAILYQMATEFKQVFFFKKKTPVLSLPRLCLAGSALGPEDLMCSILRTLDIRVMFKKLLMILRFHVSIFLY